MRVRAYGRCRVWLLGTLALACSAGAHEFVGREGPAWMRVDLRSHRQAAQSPSPERNITASPGEDRDACWSPDGTLIAFASNRAGDFDIYICRPDGSNPDTGAALSPKRVSGLPGNERYPCWSPGGTELAYVRENGIYIRNLRTGVENLVSDNVGTPTGLVFSFDGARLAFSAVIGQDLRPNIYWISLDPRNPNLEQITNTAYDDVAPAWFPQSSQLLFASTRDGDLDIWQVTVPGIGAGPVAEGNWTKVIGGAGNQTEPAWVNRGGINVTPYDQAFHILYADDGGGQDYDIKLADSDGDSVSGSGDQVSPLETGPQRTNQTEPFANPQQRASDNLCVYSSNQTGNYDLFVIEIFDESPPVLSDLTGKPTLPTVTPQRTFPGATVTIRANVLDVGSGVSEVWALIRRAEAPVFQRNSIGTGQDEDEGVLGSSGENRVMMGAINIEFDQLIIDANTYADVDPTTVTLTAAGLTTMVRTSGLQLLDDGNPPDEVAGDGVYTAQWQTPATAQDYYVDIIPFDGRGNVPIDLNLGVNNRPGGGSNELNYIQQGFDLNRPGVGVPFYVIGYDHVAGFTTRQLDLTRKILFVSDYACGQKFQVADFAGVGQTTLNRFWPAALPVEHWYFSSDDSNATSVAGTPMFRAVGSSPPTVHVFGNPYLGSIGFPPPTGLETGDIAMIERFGGSSPYGGPQQADQKAVWRILCRGKVDASTLNAYTPLPLPPAPGSPIPSQDGDRMILWVSPYTGDLFVQPGTLLDAEVQSDLTNFVASGGRLFVTGQDVAWALTKNGTQTNGFLRNVLRADFVSDAAPDVMSSTTQPAFQRRDLTLATSMTGIERQVFIGEQNPITNDLYVDFYRWTLFRGEFHPPDASDSRIRLLGGSYGDWAGDACPNGWFIDDVTPASGGIPTLNYASGGQTAMVRYIDAATGGRVVFCAFPFEAMRNNYRYYASYQPNQNWVIGHENRVELFTNISDYLRTGALLGKVVGPDGSSPVGGVQIEGRVGPNPDGQLMSVTTTLNDGTYLLRGLSTGNYSVYVNSSEFTADHRPYQPVFGGQITRNADLTIRLLRFETGTIFGTVTQTGGATVANVEVTATLQTTGANPMSSSKRTDNNGQYSIDVPAGTYTVTASAPGFGSASQTNVVVVAGDFVQVDLVLQPAPGTLRGNVKGNNQPVNGATIAIVKGGVTTNTTTTNSAGNYEIQLPAGTYDLVVTAAGFQQATRTGVEILSDQVTGGIDFDLQAVPPGSITGLITLQGSTDPVAGAVVQLVAGGVILRSTTSAATTTTQDGDTYNYRFDDVPAGVYEVRLTAQGFSADPRTGVQVQSNRVTTDVDFTLQPLHTFIAGLSMTSTPFDYASAAPDIQTIIDDDDNRNTRLKLATWDTLAGAYVFYPNQPANTFRLGKGYFMRLAKNVPLTVEGVRAPVVGSGHQMQLLTGWNLIGHVYEFPVDLFACEVLFQGQTYTIQQAAARGLVNASLYTLNFNEYQQLFRFDPYTAYWIRAFQNVVLRIPPASLSSSREETRATREQPTLGGWTAEILARTGNGLQARGVFGVNADAADVHDSRDREQPPRPPVDGFLEVVFPHPEWGRYSGRYRTDVRGQSRQATWEMEVWCDRPGETIELSWPALGASVPGGLRVVLEDRETGWKRSLRHTGGYSFRMERAGGRSFVLRVEPNTTMLSFGDVRFRPSRGAGGELVYTLGAAATVDVAVRSPTGRMVRHLLQNVGQEAGLQRVVWDGRDDQGRLVPSGNYRIDLVGTTEIGEQVRVTRVIQHRR